MATIGGSGSGACGTVRTGPIDEGIHGIIVVRVVEAISEVILECFGLVKTALIEESYRCFVVVV